FQDRQPAEDRDRVLLPRRALLVQAADDDRRAVGDRHLTLDAVALPRRRQRRAGLRDRLAGEAAQGDRVFQLEVVALADVRGDDGAVEADAGDEAQLAGLGVGRAEAEVAEGDDLVLGARWAVGAQFDADGQVSGRVEGDDGAFDQDLRAAFVQGADELLIQPL